MMDDATHDRISANASAASWRHVVAGMPELVAAQAEPESIVEWLDGCWPQARAGAATLMRALAAQPWRMAKAPPGEEGPGHASFVIHAGHRAWAVRLHVVASEIVASHVERVGEVLSRSEP